MISVGMGSLALARDYLAKGEGKRSLFYGYACVSEAQWQAVVRSPVRLVLKLNIVFFIKL
tara:strand:+ start:1142 stop:1321 length:180 start_codon:yes stop_codon:yes gene_type:complete